MPLSTHGLDIPILGVGGVVLDVDIPEAVTHSTSV
jgi:hypothetical protein